MSTGFHRLGANVPGKLTGFSNQTFGGPVLKVEPPPVSLAEDPSHPETELVPTPLPTNSKDAARQMGYTGDQCSHCSSMKMKISGHCLVCEDCGTTTGCS